jgi:uncharacterized Zn finger protein (UPF0148 family)
MKLYCNKCGEPLFANPSKYDTTVYYSCPCGTDIRVEKQDIDNEEELAELAGQDPYGGTV